eukprot:scaffold420_cov342-Pavlova_lutheri.AAC.6
MFGICESRRSNRRVFDHHDVEEGNRIDRLTIVLVSAVDIVEAATDEETRDVVTTTISSSRKDSLHNVAPPKGREDQRRQGRSLEAFRQAPKGCIPDAIRVVGLGPEASPREDPCLAQGAPSA